MSVELNPPELGFRRPFTQEVSQSLRLRNPNHEPVAFKVKTTAPKQYCVRPNSGRIEPGNEVEVQVLLQAMKEDPPPDAKCRDKFLVQSVAVTADRESSNMAIWQQVEQTKSAIQEKKIRVSFLPADGSISTPVHQNINGSDRGETPGDPPAYRSPSPDASTPSQYTTAGAVSKPESRPADNKHLGDAVASAHNPAMGNQQSSLSSTVSNAASSVANAIPTSGADLKAQLAEAQAQIKQLKDQATEQGLRQRKSDAVNQDSRERITTGTTGLGVQQQPSEGVSVQIVAGLCLLSFLLAYLFF